MKKMIKIESGSFAALVRSYKSRLSIRRVVVLLQYVSKYSPPNRTYTFLRIRLSITNISLYIA